MRRLELLIEVARTLSGNERYDANSGVSQRSFVQFFQNAQDALVKEAANTKSKLLLKSKTIPVVSGQELYAFPTDIYLHNIDTLEYSSNQVDWIILDRCLTKDRMAAQNGYPYGYFTQSDGIHVTPTISNGYLRINYLKNPLRVERRLTSATTVAIGVGTIQVTPTWNDSTDQAYAAKFQYFCLAGADGAIKARNIPYAALAAPTSYTFETGDSAASGDFVIADQYATNKIDLPDICESYLIKHAMYEAMYGDASKWSQESKDDMRSSLKQLVDSFGSLSDDVSQIPITNWDYLVL